MTGANTNQLLFYNGPDEKIAKSRKCARLAQNELKTCLDKTWGLGDAVVAHIDVFRQRDREGQIAEEGIRSEQVQSGWGGVGGGWQAGAREISVAGRRLKGERGRCVGG